MLENYEISLSLIYLKNEIKSNLHVTDENAQIKKLLESYKNLIEPTTAELFMYTSQGSKTNLCRKANLLARLVLVDVNL